MANKQANASIFDVSGDVISVSVLALDVLITLEKIRTVIEPM